MDEEIMAVGSKLIPQILVGHLLAARHFAGLGMELALCGVRLTRNKPLHEGDSMSAVMTTRH